MPSCKGSTQIRVTRFCKNKQCPIGVDATNNVAYEGGRDGHPVGRYRTVPSRLMVLPKLRSMFTKRLKEARLALGISQRELGRRIGLSEDVVSSRVTRYELGTSEPDFETASRLAKELGVPLAYLLADTEVLGDIVLSASSLSPTEQRKLAAELRAGRAAKPSPSP